MSNTVDAIKAAAPFATAVVAVYAIRGSQFAQLRRERLHELGNKLDEFVDELDVLARSVADLYDVPEFVGAPGADPERSGRALIDAANFGVSTNRLARRIHEDAAVIDAARKYRNAAAWLILRAAESYPAAMSTTDHPQIEAAHRALDLYEGAIDDECRELLRRSKVADRREPIKQADALLAAHALDLRDPTAWVPPDDWQS